MGWGPGRVWREGLVGLAVVIMAAATAAGAEPPPGPFAGGGPSLVYQSLSLPRLNEMLAKASTPLPTLPDSLWLIGGGGYGPVPGSGGRLAIGGFGAGTLYDRSAGSKRLRFAMGYGGVRLGYRRALTKPFFLDAGLSVAFGGATLTVIHGTSSSFQDGLNNPQETTFSRFILGLVPDVALAVSLTPRIHLQVGAGYFYDTRLFGGWQNAGGGPVPQAPEDSFSGVQYRLTLVFGPSEQDRARFTKEPAEL